MEWKAVSREKSLEIVSAAINCRFSGEGLRISTISECLRSVLHQYSVLDIEEARQAVASLRLTSAVRRKLAPLWPDITDTGDATHPGIMAVLDSLAELGDMIRLEGGKWLTAPLHAIRTDNKMAILLGGDPVYALSTDIVTKAIGRTRLVEQDACEGRAELWDAGEWIGAPVEGNESWSSKLLAKAQSKFTDAPNNIGEATAYVQGKWINFSELPSHENKIHLCKIFIGTSFSYFLGEVVAGHLRKMSSIESSDDVKRLRFCLDMKENCQMKVKIKTSHGLARLRLFRRLPERESRVLLLGWSDSGPEGEHSGITHHVFPEEILPIVRCAFEGLGIIWVNESTRRSEI